jgi:hypothetical protein
MRHGLNQKLFAFTDDVIANCIRKNRASDNDPRGAICPICSTGDSGDPYGRIVPLGRSRNTQTRALPIAVKDTFGPCGLETPAGVLEQEYGPRSRCWR